MAGQGWTGRPDCPQPPSPALPPPGFPSPPRSRPRPLAAAPAPATGTRPEFSCAESLSPLVRPLRSPGVKCHLISAQDSRAWSRGAGCFLNRGLSAHDPVLTVGYLAQEPLLVARLPLGSGAQ